MIIIMIYNIFIIITCLTIIFINIIITIITRIVIINITTYLQSDDEDIAANEPSFLKDLAEQISSIGEILF